MRLTHYEKQVALLIAKHTHPALKKALGRRLRKGLTTKVRFNPNQPDRPGIPLDKCLPQLAGMDVRNAMANSHLMTIVRETVQSWVVNQCTGSRNLLPIEVSDAVVKELIDKAALLDLELRMPPTRSDGARRAAKPARTLVQRRADKACRYLKAWQRRAAMAKTKIAAYRKKVAYYKQKGVIQ